MEYPHRNFVVSLAVIAFIAASNPVVAETPPVVHVCTENESQVPVSVLREAQADASRIFAAIGVDVVWRSGASENGPPCRLLSITGQEHPDPRHLGVAPSAAGKACRRASVFFPRVLRATITHMGRLEKVLAVVMAHELGHMLLPIGWHASDGLMQERFGGEEIRLAGRGALLFSKAGAGLIRVSLGARPEWPVAAIEATVVNAK